MIYLAYFTFATLLVYLVIFSILIVHWKKTKEFHCPLEYHPQTKVSVIIPIRNEADHILNCLNSLINQDYPEGLFEIIVVDDQSYDETPDILEAFDHPNFKCMRLGVEKRTTIEGSKKKAISYGVSHANGDLIITTDGDCILPIQWIKTIVAYYEETKAKLIVGPVALYSNKGLFQIFQSLDFMSSFLVQTAGISSRLFYLCSGANLAYEKKAFLEANPYETNLHIPSGDDIFLIQRFQKLYRGQIKVIKSTAAICSTKPEGSIGQFMSQRLRWATKMKLSSGGVSLLIASLIWAQKILPWAILFIAIYFKNQNLILLSISTLMLGFILDFILLYSATKFFNKTNNLWWFLPVEIIHSIYYFSLGILSWFPISLEWKDRKIN